MVRAKPNPTQVKKLRNQLIPFEGLSVLKKLDVAFDGVNSYEDGFNIATLTLAFKPEQNEMIDGEEYPTRIAIHIMRVELRQFKAYQQIKKSLVVYPNRGPTEDGEWRYFNMQKVDEWSIIEKWDGLIIKALRKSINVITTLLKENPEYRNKKHHTEVAQIRYELMLRNRMLKRLEKKKQILASGETEDNESNEK